jgi:hypothetical protein
MLRDRIRERVKPFTVPGDKPSPVALVRNYEHLLMVSDRPDLWLHGLFPVLERARTHDAELDARLQRILSPQPTRDKMPIRIGWIDTVMQSEEPRPSMAWRHGKPTVTRLQRGRKAG